MPNLAYADGDIVPRGVSANGPLGRGIHSGAGVHGATTPSTDDRRLPLGLAIQARGLIGGLLMRDKARLMVLAGPRDS
jgi:hypothetical protein